MGDWEGGEQVLCGKESWIDMFVDGGGGKGLNKL